MAFWVFMALVFLSTPSARRATLSDQKYQHRKAISIHALREEGDRVPRQGQDQHCDFYPRPPRGGRPTHGTTASRTQNFYPRPPRGGRHEQIYVYQVLYDFYPRPPRGGRPTSVGCVTFWFHFYPRPPRGGRPTSVGCVTFWFLFLSTPSARRATERHQNHDGDSGISIHALREEGDKALPRQPEQAGYFYPRPPRGGRQQKQRQNLYFQTNYTTFCTNLEEP